MREKVRYAVVEVLPCDDLNFNKEEVFDEIKSSVLKLFGLSGLSEAKLWVINNSWNKNMGIIKVDRTFINKFKASVLTIKEINKKKASVRTLKVSGTLKKAKSFLNEYKRRL